MEFDVCFKAGEVQVSLTEKLSIPEGHRAQLGSSDGQADFDLLTRIEDMMREFLSGFVFPVKGLDHGND